MRFWAAVLLTLLSQIPAASARLDSYVIEPKPPQARSREEFKAYLDLAQAEVPQEILDLAARFLKRFPSSEFQAQVYRFEMHAHRSLGDLERTIEAGEKSRAANPFDVDTLLTLASVLPSQAPGRKDFDGILERAADYAIRALQELATLKAPRTIPLSDWLAFLQRMRASGHESLGVVAFKRENFSESVLEFERCIEENALPEGSQFFRLGVAYQYTGEKEKAIAALKRAIELGPEVVAAKAQVQLGELQETKP